MTLSNEPDAVGKLTADLARRSQGRDHHQQLDYFYAQGLITELLGIIKIGKEASVYLCRAGSGLGVEYVAAKVYRARQYRFKNDYVYQEGRTRGMKGQAIRALARKSRTGREVQTASWVHAEYETMQVLHAAGADVPRPLACAQDAIIMEYIGDDQEPAPRLVEVALEPEEAQPAFERVIDNVELFLSCDRVHADLSAHNILYADGQVTVIDFPQAVDPRFNHSALDFLHRDVDNVCRHFARFGVQSDPWFLAEDLWRRYTYAQL